MRLNDDKLQAIWRLSVTLLILAALAALGFAAVAPDVRASEDAYQVRAVVDLEYGGAKWRQASIWYRGAPSCTVLLFYSIDENFNESDKAETWRPYNGVVWFCDVGMPPAAIFPDGLKQAGTYSRSEQPQPPEQPE